MLIKKDCLVAVDYALYYLARYQEINQDSPDTPSPTYDSPTKSDPRTTLESARLRNENKRLRQELKKFLPSKDGPERAAQKLESILPVDITALLRHENAEFREKCEKLEKELEELSEKFLEADELYKLQEGTIERLKQTSAQLRVDNSSLILENRKLKKCNEQLERMANLIDDVKANYKETFGEDLENREMEAQKRKENERKQKEKIGRLNKSEIVKIDIKATKKSKKKLKIKKTGHISCPGINEMMPEIRFSFGNRSNGVIEEEQQEHWEVLKQYSISIKPILKFKPKLSIVGGKSYSIYGVVTRKESFGISPGPMLAIEKIFKINIKSNATEKTNQVEENHLNNQRNRQIQLKIKKQDQNISIKPYNIKEYQFYESDEDTKSSASFTTSNTSFNIFPEYQQLEYFSKNIYIAPLKKVKAVKTIQNKTYFNTTTKSYGFFPDAKKLSLESNYMKIDRKSLKKFSAFDIQIKPKIEKTTKIVTQNQNSYHTLSSISVIPQHQKLTIQSLGIKISRDISNNKNTTFSSCNIKPPQQSLGIFSKNIFIPKSNNNSKEILKVIKINPTKQDISISQFSYSIKTQKNLKSCNQTSLVIPQVAHKLEIRSFEVFTSDKRRGTFSDSEEIEVFNSLALRKSCLILSNLGILNCKPQKQEVSLSKLPSIVLKKSTKGFTNLIQNFNFGPTLQNLQFTTSETFSIFKPIIQLDFWVGKKINISSAKSITTDEEETKSTGSSSPRRNRRAPPPRKSAMEEYFAMTLQAVKMNAPNREKIPSSLNADELFATVQQSAIPFNQWHPWLSERIQLMIKGKR